MKKMTTTWWQSAVLSVTALVLLTSPAWAIYDSGSDGSLGDLVLDGTETDVEIALPPDGVLNYENVSIAQGVTVTFTKNADNTPVYLLATGDMLIEGAIDLPQGDSVQQCKIHPYIANCGGEPPPGGFWGGFENTAGQGPLGQSYHPTGILTLPTERILLQGGSGSGRANASSCCCYGYSGGGAITVASNGSILLSGQINAKSGSVRLISDTISGNGSVDAGQSCSTGRVKMEAFLFEGNVVVNADPDPTLSTPQVAIPYAAGQRPRIEIVSVDGQTASFGSHPQLPALSLTQGKLNVVQIKTEYIPLGETLQLRYAFSTSSDPNTVESAPVTGTFESGSATAEFTVPDGQKVGWMQVVKTSVPVTAQ